MSQTAELKLMRPYTAYFYPQPGAVVQDGSDAFTVLEDFSDASPDLRYNGDTANGGSTASQTNEMGFLVHVPNSYAGGDLTVTVNAATSPTANTSSTVDVTAFAQTDAGIATGSDLCETAAQNSNSATAANFSFTIDGDGLSAGSTVLVNVVTVNNDTGGTSDSIAYIGKISVSCSCYGGIWA